MVLFFGDDLNIPDRVKADPRRVRALRLPRANEDGDVMDLMTSKCLFTASINEDSE